MNRHIVTTPEGIEAAALAEALAAAGIEADAQPAHLQGAAKLAALVLAEYPADQRHSARDTMNRWITEAMEDPAMTTEVIYRIDRPFASGVVEVYGEPDMGWYEWRIIEGDRAEIRKGGGKVLEDSGRHSSYGMQYGSPAIALRDGINRDDEATG